MKVGFLIIGRLKSTRLPKKIMLEVKDKPYMEHMFDHIRLSKKTDVIVLCTSTNSEDDPLEEVAKKNGIECYRGDEDDVIKRLHDAAEMYNLDYILTITADCPLVDPEYADKVAEAFEQTNADLITAMDLPHGAFTHGIKPSALKKVMEIKDSQDTEVWHRYFFDTGIFEHYKLPIENKKHFRPDIRMTLDYPEDHEFFKALLDGIYEEGSVASIDQLIDYVDQNPEVLKINQHCSSLYLKRYTSQSDIKLRARFDVERFVVFGCGSIGQRHIRNLQSLGVNEIAAFRTRSGHCQELPDDIKVKELFDWQEVLDFKPDAAIIANPTSLHVETALKIAPYVKGLFIEKPLSHSMEKIDEYLKLAKENGAITFIGYNMQFHPAIKAIQDEINKGELGKPLNFQCQVGQWLPDWHPYEDFRQSYSAKSELGGGVTLTLIHEINLAQKLFGPFSRVAAFFPETDKLEIDADAISDVMIHHKDGGISQVHLDYIQNPKSRTGTIICEHGLIRYDLNKGIVTLQGQENEESVLWVDKSFDLNETYVDELKLFIQYAKEGRLRHDFDGERASEDLKLVNAAFDSEKTGQIMSVGV